MLKYITVKHNMSKYNTVKYNKYYIQFLHTSSNSFYTTPVEVYHIKMHRMQLIIQLRNKSPLRYHFMDYIHQNKHL